MTEVTAMNYEASALYVANQAITAELGSSSTRIRLKSRSGNVLSEDSILGPKGAKGDTGDKGATPPARAVHFQTISMTFVANVVASVDVTFPAGRFSAAPNAYVVAATSNISTNGSSKASGIYGLAAYGVTKDRAIIYGVSRSSGAFGIRVFAMAKD